MFCALVFISPNIHGCIGVVSQMPLATLEYVNLADNRTYMQPRTTKDVASVGHYKTSFRNGVVAQMSATDHAGILEYTYPESGGRYVLVDVSHYLPAHGAPRTAQWYSNGQIELSETGQRYKGYGIWRGGWGLGTTDISFLALGNVELTCLTYRRELSGFHVWRV